jgi:thymidine kinase
MKILYWMRRTGKTRKIIKEMYRLQQGGYDCILVTPTIDCGKIVKIMAKEMGLPLTNEPLSINMIIDNVDSYIRKYKHPLIFMDDAERSLNRIFRNRVAVITMSDTTNIDGLVDDWFDINNPIE